MKQLCARPGEFIAHRLYMRQHEDRLYYIHNHDSWPAGDRAITHGYGSPAEAAAAAKAIAGKWDKAKKKGTAA